MLEITPQQRRELRAKAHPLHPVVSVGQHGLTPQVLHEIDVALAAHELIKVRVFDDDRAAREAMLASIADAVGAAPVQHLGKLLILWRPAPPKETAQPRAAKKPAKKASARRPPLARGRSPRATSFEADRRRTDGETGSLRRRASARDGLHRAPAPAGNGSRRRRRGSER
jgi:putative YhbY family RNA-binding protein